MAAANPSVTVNEGQTAANSGTYSDPNAGDNVAISASVGTVTKTGTNSGTWSWSFGTSDGPDQTQTVTITANDGQGGIATTTFALTVKNEAPTISLTGSTSVDEGTLYTLNLGSVVDPGTDTVSACSINWGDGTSVQSCLGSIGSTMTHTYADDNPTVTTSDLYTITVSLTDEDGSYPSAGTKSVTVNNVAPTITSYVANASGALYALGTATTLTLSFTDPGLPDTQTCAITWDDGSPAFSGAGAWNNSNSAGACTFTKTFASAGTYTTQARVTDDDSGSATSAFLIVIVYDPSAGFVTGGGWFQSGAGACPGCPSGGDPTGRASFGFVSRYQRGATVPTGETEFQFQVGGLNFHSSSYQWLVVSGTSKAQYKGTGTINGTGSYTFLLTVIDNGSSGDRFRIRITGSADLVNGLVYDNAPGNNDLDNSPTQLINGGQIVIHTR